ncbi:MAG TPA: ABC transporter ATP-binding protein [Planctomycetota bacterium]|nr:ABC transporter ATP-binding protein [Planctomycetota bacterium]
MKFFVRALSFFRQDRWHIFLLMGLIGCSVIVGLLQAWPMAILVDAVLSPVPRSDWMHRLFLAPLPDDRLSQVIGITLIGMFLKLLQDSIFLWRTMLNYGLKYRGTSRVRRKLYDKLQELGLAYQRRCPQGDSIYRLSTDALGPFGILDTIIGTTVAAVTLTGMTLVMLSRSVPLTLFALSIAPALLLTARYFGRVIKRRTLESKQADADLTTATQRGISCMSLIQSFCRNAKEALRFGRAVDTSADSAMRMHWKESLYPLAVQSIFALGGAIIFGYGGYLVYRDQFLTPVPNGLTCGDLMVFMAYLGQLWDPLGFVAGFQARIQTHCAATERVFTVLEQAPAVTPNDEAPELPLRKRAVVFNGVSFAYPSQTPVLKNIQATILPGQLVAFVGPSGSGKSTLLQLAARIYDPLGGRVMLDGHDLSTLRLQDVRKHVALIWQDNPLLPASVAENIAYSCPGSSDEDVIAAAQLAGAHEFIEKLPDGYATCVAENGQNFSGGQKQRLALARAFLSNAPILCLDEPTSALDPQSARLVMDALEQQRGGRTIILVTHHVEAVATCDQIFVLREGNIVEHGTHEQLLERDGAYVELLEAARMEQERSPATDAA